MVCRGLCPGRGAPSLLGCLADDLLLAEGYQIVEGVLGDTGSVGERNVWVVSVCVCVSECVCVCRCVCVGI